MVDDGDVPFAGTEDYYAAHRPDYARAAIVYLVERFGVDADARVLDLGCGTGRLTVPLARHTGAVVGMDPNPAMLDQTRARAADADVENVVLVRGDDAALRDDTPGPVASVADVHATDRFRLTTMGRSFHWMDQRATLDTLHGLLASGGGVAIVTGNELLTRHDAPWAAAVYDLVADYLDDVPDRRIGDVEYEDPWDAMLAERGYEDVESRTFDQTVRWTVDRVVGYVFSLSFAPREAFGDDADAFERDVQDRLTEFDQDVFEQEAPTEVISAREP